MSAYLESFLELHPGSKYLFTEDDDPKGPNRLKSKYASDVRDNVWRTDDFVALAPEASPLNKNGWPSDIGTHSGRKCPAEYAANCGRHVTEVEIRGRWKGQRGGRVVFRYVNAQQAFEDANVAATLCRGGPVRYKVKDSVVLTDAWLFEHVVPNIRRKYPRDDRLCRVLGHALLYICLSSNEEVLISSPLRNRVKAAYAALGLDEEQPLEKVALHLYRMPNGTFGISDVVPTGTDLAAGQQRPGAPMTAEMGQTFLVQMNQMKTDQSQMNLNLMQAIGESRAENRKLARIVNNNIRA